MAHIRFALRFGTVAAGLWLAACSSLEIRNAAFTPDASSVQQTRRTALGDLQSIPVDPRCVNGLCPIDILFGTSRKIVSGLAPSNADEVFDDLTITKERGDALKLGRLSVMPRHRRSSGSTPCGDLQTVLSVTPDTNYQVSSRVQVFGSDEEFAAAARPLMSGQRDALIFIHGYRVSFRAAAQRLAQLVEDTGFCGTPFLFSWPSEASLFGYLYDRDSAEYSAQYFRQFLAKVRGLNSSGVHIIAHSMGNMVLLRSLTELREQESLFPSASATIKEIILAAPDVDKDLFGQFVSRIKQIGSGMTLYASSRDWAVWFSSTLSRRSTRAGYVDQQAIVAPFVETIDVSNVASRWSTWTNLGHSSYAELSPIMEDIRALIVSTPDNAPKHPPDLRRPFWTKNKLGNWVYQKVRGRSS